MKKTAATRAGCAARSACTYTVNSAQKAELEKVRSFAGENLEDRARPLLRRCFCTSLLQTRRICRGVQYASLIFIYRMRCTDTPSSSHLFFPPRFGITIPSLCLLLILSLRQNKQPSINCLNTDAISSPVRL